MSNFDTNIWLPTSKKEVERRGWSELDIILFTGDAYIDHPGFGIAVIGRVLEERGYKVLRFWGSELRKKPEECLEKILKVF